MSATATSCRAGYSLKRRLYGLIAFLALLPFCGVLITLIGQQRIAADNGALDHVANGTIRLERVNGLVYAVVMESRGIYMSADWATAKQFADNLLADLAELKRELPEWQADAGALQEANVKELSQRIEQFIQFRTELVRIGKEENTAAARVFGDNDANRNVRASLNHSLETLTLAYQEELTRLRANVASGERAFILALGVLAMLGALVLCSGLLLVRNSLLRPLLWLRSWMLRLAAGDLDGVVNGHERAVEIAEMAAAVETFRLNLVDRQRLNQESGLLASLDDWLQSANSLSELYDMVGTFLGKLLPECSGSLYVYANSRDVLENAKGWNAAEGVATIRPDDCWALRRGRTYTFGEHELDFPCGHVADAASMPYCCIPILAHGETVGLLYLTLNTADHESTGSTAAAIVSQRRLGVVCAEHISLAIANVKLRDQLRDQSIRDPLTGLFNRRYLLETTRREFARAVRTGQSIGVLSMDIDHFKRFNDTYGHDAGDAVLRAVGGCLASMFRSDDIACRFGGEEFVGILTGAALDAAVRRAEEVRTSIESLTLRHLDQTLPRITISIGVAAFPAFGDTPEAVLKAADSALYRAKEAGRNRVERAIGSHEMPPLFEPEAATALAEVTPAPVPMLPLAADG